MLRVVHGNRADALLAALLDALPAPLDPFAPSTIVVGSHLVGRWLRREIALTRGIAAGLELAVLDTFLARTYTGDATARAAGLTALDRRTLGVVLASVLADPETIDALPAVRAYLDAAPDAGDRAGPRRVQLADRLASLYMAYATTRPDWMPALLAGHVPSELQADATARWQAALLAATMRRLARAAPGKTYAVGAQLPWARRRSGLPAPRLAGPLAVFGVSYLRRAELEALSDLAADGDVTIYFGNPCEELWDDVGGRRATSGDPLPLTLWGRPARDSLAALIERTGGDLDGRFVDGGGASARARLFDDVLHRRAPSGERAAEAGVTVIAAPSVRRELELVADHVRRRLDADPSLRAHELGVWIAGDAPERYLAHAPAAFEAVAVPCHLIDAPIDDRGRIGEAVLALLELPTSARTRGDLLRVMTHPAVLARHAHVDAADWVRWTERLGIARGADADSHVGTYLEPFPMRFHWDQGVRRLALGAFMVGERAGRGAVTFGDVELAPEELRPDQQASAATYALLVRSLCADAKWLATQDRPLAEWAMIFAQLVDAYLGPRDPEAVRDLERVRGILAGLAAVDVDGRRLGFREARAHAQRRLTSERANRGEALAAGVMVAPLAAMRAIPFRVVFVVGLDAGGFPASETINPLDLRRDVRAGDVSGRERDRYAFFEAILGARDACFLSYVAAEPKSGEVLGPSSVVLELADALAPYLGATSTEAALAIVTERHPLHRFATAPGAGAAPVTVVPAAQRERWAVTVRAALGDHLRRLGVEVPDEDGMQRLLAAPAQAALAHALGLTIAPPTTAATALRTVSITTLREFLESPVQAWAKAALGLAELADETVIDDDDEPFGLDPPTRATLLREIFAAHLRDPARSLAEHYTAAITAHQLRGHFPVGVFGTATAANDLALLQRWRAALGAVPAGTATRIAFGRASSPVATLHAALEIPLPGGAGTFARLAGQTELLIRVGDHHESVTPLTGEIKKAGRHHLRGLLDHVVLAAAGFAPAGHAHRLLGNDGKERRIEHAPWSQADARAYLGALIAELFGLAHGYALPFDLLVKAHAGKPVSLSSRGEDTHAIGYGPVERTDGLDLPDDPAAIAQRRLGPLISHLRGEHDFEAAP